MTTPDYYEVLQVSPKAEVDIIGAPYKRLAFKWHPDRRPGDSSASEQMWLLKEAYATHSDPEAYRRGRAGFATKPEQSGSRSPAAGIRAAPGFQRPAFFNGAGSGRTGWICLVILGP